MRISRVTQLSLGFALAMMIANVTFAQNVKTDFNKSADFSGYKTFMWIKEPNTTNPLMKQRVVDDVNAALTDSRLQLVTSNADLASQPHSYEGSEHAEHLLHGFGGGWRWVGGFGSATTWSTRMSVARWLSICRYPQKESILERPSSTALRQSAEERGQPNKAVSEDVQERPTGSERKRTSGQQDHDRVRLERIHRDRRGS